VSAQGDLGRISGAMNVIEHFPLARKLCVGGTAIASWSFNVHQCYVQDRQVFVLVMWHCHAVELMVGMHHRRSKQAGPDLLESPTMAGPRSSSPCERLITLRPSLCWKSFRHTKHNLLMARVLTSIHASRSCLRRSEQRQPFTSPRKALHRAGQARTLQHRIQMSPRRPVWFSQDEDRHRPMHWQRSCIQMLSCRVDCAKLDGNIKFACPLFISIDLMLSDLCSLNALMTRAAIPQTGHLHLGSDVKPGNNQT
jgi:hypothetical protein